MTSMGRSSGATAGLLRRCAAMLARNDSKRPRAAWPQPEKPTGRVFLHLHEPVGDGEEPIAHDISAAARAGDTLFIGADECAYVEVLDLVSKDEFGNHRRICLSQFFDLPGGAEEMDIEGLALHGKWLWVVGSHSLTRRKPKKNKPLNARSVARLAELKDNDNRFFVGRLPVKRLEGEGERYDVNASAGAHKAQMLPIGKHGSALAKILRHDPLFAPFLCLPAKENGLDVEGVLVDHHRVALGLRGPVINGWACVLDFEVRSDTHTTLELHGDVRRRWLDLGGLGIRDLKRRGEDALILAGPTMKLDGPVQVYLWRNWLRLPDEDNQLETPAWLMDLPYGYSCDHPEALAPWSEDELLVVCDAPAPERLDRRGGIVADIFAYDVGT
jgi:hypothetical protein